MSTASPRLFSAIVLLSVLAGCGGDDGGTGTPMGPATVASVTIDGASPNLDVGGSLSLTAIARSADGQPIPATTFTWSTEAPAVAAVSASGVISGVSKGLASITATASGRSATVTLSVAPTFTPGGVAASTTDSVGQFAVFSPSFEGLHIGVEVVGEDGPIEGLLVEYSENADHLTLSIVDTTGFYLPGLIVGTPDQLAAGPQLQDLVLQGVTPPSLEASSDLVLLPITLAYFAVKLGDAQLVKERGFALVQSFYHGFDSGQPICRTTTDLVGWLAGQQLVQQGVVQDFLAIFSAGFGAAAGEPLLDMALIAIDLPDGGAIPPIDVATLRAALASLSGLSEGEIPTDPNHRWRVIENRVASVLSGERWVVVELVPDDPLCSAPSSSSLVAHYTLDVDGSDVSGNGNNGSLQPSGSAGPSFASGRIGQALRFDGLDDFIDVAGPSGLDAITQEITLSAWVSGGAEGLRNSMILAKRPFDGTVQYLLKIASTTGISFQFGGSPNQPAVFATSPTAFSMLDDGNWHHIAVTHRFGSGADPVIYVDGQPQVGNWLSGNADLLTVANTASLRIANQASASPGQFRGLLDDVRIYNAVLKSTEIASLANP